MEDLFSKVSLCYLTSRFDEGFQLLSSSFLPSNEQFHLNKEHEQIFCLISMKVLHSRYQSLMKLHQLLIDKDHRNISLHFIENYFNEIINELTNYSKQILFLIENIYFISNSSSSAQSLNKIINKLININT